MPDKHTHPWPRLSADLPFPRHPLGCQACGRSFAGGEAELSRWQEHDDADRPELIVVVLCLWCANALIEPHPRLYRPLDQHEPWPGCLPLCADCTRRDGLRCTHPDLKANGGPGLKLTMPAPTTIHIDYRDKAGRRRGEWRTLYHGPVSACAGKTTTEEPH